MCIITSNNCNTSYLRTHVMSFADTSIAARNGGCFPASATVQLESGDTRSMTNLSVGDRVLTAHSDGSLRYDNIVTFLHRQPLLVTSFSVIATVAGQRLVATGDHLIFTSRNQSASSFTDDASPTFIAYLQPGNDSLYVATPHSKHLSVSVVTNISTVIGRGVYAPLTPSGTIVVDGVVVSCYALVISHRVAHYVLTPLRHICSWWNCYDTTLSSLDGVHWYAHFLRRLAEFLSPDSYLWFVR